MSSLNKDFLIKLSSFWFFHRWHPEVSLRYLPIVSEIKKLPSNVTILDVGSGGLGIGPYLKRKITGVDLDFSPPISEYLTPVKGSALRLPIENNAYDIVVSVDMLEHLKKSDRVKAISEMLRVGKKMVCIAVPCGHKSQEQDEKLDKEYVKIHKERFHFLDEQIGFKLPEKTDIYNTIRRESLLQHKKVNIRILDNENLNLRYFLMKGWMSKNVFLDFLFRKIMLLFIPYFLLIKAKPAYRQIFIVSIYK